VRTTAVNSAKERVLRARESARHLHIQDTVISHGVRVPRLLPLLAVMLAALTLAGCGIPYHPQAGQGPYVYSPLPG
jgi:hypothetical protein